MASTYSTNLAIELIGTGEQSGTWGTTTNTNLGTLIEQSISGYVTQAITDGSGANTTITIPNGATGVARNMFIEMTGALTFSTTSLIVPANKKMYFIFNNTTGGFAVTVKVSGQTGILVPNGKKVVLTSNGTDIVEAHTAIVGNATMGGTLGVTGVTTIANGSVSAPSLAFAGATTTGFYKGTGNAIDATLNGTQVLDINASSFDVKGGLAANFPANVTITGTTTAAAINASGAITATPSISIGSTANEWSGAPSAVNPLIQANGTTSYGTITGASSRADGTGLRIGSFTGEYQTNSATHKTIGVMDFVTTGTTANQRGGGWNLTLKADGSTSTTTVISATVAGGASVTGTLSVSSTSTMAAINASGKITSTLGNNQLIFDSASATTGLQYMRIINTGGSIVLGIENSTGGGGITGDTAYDATISGANGIAFSANNGAAMHMRLAPTGLSVTGTLSISGAVSGASFAPTVATVPANGMYLPSANALGFAVNSTQALNISSLGNIVTSALFSTNTNQFMYTTNLNAGSSASSSNGVRSDAGFFSLYANSAAYSTNPGAGVLYSTMATGTIIWDNSTSPLLSFKVATTVGMTISSAGNVGIGVTGSSAKVDSRITDGGNPGSSQIGITAKANFWASSDGWVNGTPQISFGGAGTTYAPAAIGMVTTSQSGYSYGDLVFSTRSVTTDTQPTERMRITSAGAVTIPAQINFGERAYLNSTGRISVAGATTIYSTANGGASVGMSASLVLVNGYLVATPTNSFIDLVLFMPSGTPAVISAINRGSPAARTYTSSGANLQLAMASGTYNVANSNIEQAC